MIRYYDGDEFQNWLLTVFLRPRPNNGAGATLALRVEQPERRLIVNPDQEEDEGLREVERR